MANLTDNYSFLEFFALNLLSIALGYSIKFALEKAKQKGVEIHLPVDVVAGDAFINDAKQNIFDVMDEYPMYIWRDVNG